jgi:hypothetical protein
MKYIYIITMCCFLISFSSCELFEMDDYSEPTETIKGEVVNVATGERVLTDQGSEGIRIRLRQLSWKQTATPDNFDFWCTKEGLFQNTKVFKAYYNLRIDGPFIPLVRLNLQGDTIADETKYLDIKGVTDVKFAVQPFLKVEWVGTPTISNGKITAKFKVTRATSPEDFKAKIEPMGGYNANFLEVSDVRLFVGENAFIGLRQKDDRYGLQQNYTGNAFNALLGETITITTNSEIPAGRTVFIRAAARIRYLTENISRYNYNESIRVDIPR